MSLNKISVLLVDDHELVRAGFRRLLEDGDKFQVVAESGSENRPCRILPNIILTLS